MNEQRSKTNLEIHHTFLRTFSLLRAILEFERARKHAATHGVSEALDHTVTDPLADGRSIGGVPKHRTKDSDTVPSGKYVPTVRL